MKQPQKHCVKQMRHQKPEKVFEEEDPKKSKQQKYRHLVQSPRSILLVAPT